MLQIIDAFSKACGKELPYVMDPRRDGDLPAFWADATKVRDVLGWEARFGIDEMCADGWRWQSNNPDGYGD